MSDACNFPHSANENGHQYVSEIINMGIEVAIWSGRKEGGGLGPGQVLNAKVFPLPILKACTSLTNMISTSSIAIGIASCYLW